MQNAMGLRCVFLGQYSAVYLTSSVLEVMQMVLATYVMAHCRKFLQVLLINEHSTPRELHLYIASNYLSNHARKYLLN